MLKRELELESDDDVEDLTAYLSEEKTAKVEEFIDLVTREFDFVREYNETGGTAYHPILELRHPKSDMPIVTVETDENNAYQFEYRRHRGEMGDLVGWSDSLDSSNEDQVDDILRRVRGAYQKYG